MQTIKNFRIEKIGLKYIAHIHCVAVHLSADTFGIDIPIDRIPEFCEKCTDVDWEDGKYIDILNKQYMRCIVENGRVVGLKHIVGDKTYWIDKGRKRKNDTDI